MRTQNSRTAVLVAAIAAAASLVAMAGCRGDRSNKPPRQLFPDMDDSPKFTPQSENAFFEDGRAMRPPVAGTVPFGRHHFTGVAGGAAAPPVLASFVHERDDLLKENDAIYRGIERAEQDGSLVFVDRIPILVDDALIARGQERFGIFCAICHGYYGRGEGLVGQRWTGRTVANLIDPKYLDPDEPTQRGKDGFLFHTAMEGVWAGEGPDRRQNMPPYKHALSAHDAWAVVAYIRVLQEAQQGSVEDAPPARQEQLRAELARLPRREPADPGGTGQPPAQQPVPSPQDPGAQNPQTPAPEGTPR
jgi:mono/diheme cytochrome c family protein